MPPRGPGAQEHLAAAVDDVSQSTHMGTRSTCSKKRAEAGGRAAARGERRARGWLEEAPAARRPLDGGDHLVGQRVDLVEERAEPVDPVAEAGARLGEVDEARGEHAPIVARDRRIRHGAPGQRELRACEALRLLAEIEHGLELLFRDGDDREPASA